METKLKKPAVWMIVLVSLCVLGTISSHRWTFGSEKETLDVDIKTKSAAVFEHKADPNLRTEALPAVMATPLPNPQEKSEKQDTPKRAKRTIVKPKLVKKVEPEYPDEASRAGLEGAVILEGTTDAKGKVIKTKILKGEHELLNNAATAAVKQWEYEPFIINGKPFPFEFTVTMRFSLKENDEAITTEEDVHRKVNVDVIDLFEDIELKLIKRVEPEYPREALKKLIEGKVILEALIDREGNVVSAKVIDSAHEILNDAAIDAVTQWKYAPYKENGTPKKVRYKVTVDFRLK